MRDWLPGPARQRARVSAQILRSLELFAYQRVAVPAIEYTDAVGKGFGNSEAALRFIEPETGKIAAIRSDVTPQIARLIASRFADGPWPARLAYKSNVMRRRRERARLDRQLLQVGFELIGAGEERGDLEVLECATRALRATGLETFTVDLAHAQIVGALIEPLPREARADALECLALKDTSELARVGERSGLSGRSLDALVELPQLHGEHDLWPRAEAALAGTAAEAPLISLKRIWSAAVAAELAPHVVVDLGETREFYYYTGAMFHLLAEGPGEPLGSGGRYDSLLQHFDLQCPAAGFAFDIANVCWALDERGIRDDVPIKVLLVPQANSQGQDSETAVDELLKHLRRRGIACASGPEASAAEAYRVRWDYTHILEIGTSQAVLTRPETGIESKLHHKDAEQLAAVVATELAVVEAIPHP